MTTAEVANKLVSLCREGKNLEAVESLYGDDVVSREMPGAPNELSTGIKEVFQKGEEFFNSIEEVHGAGVSDPLIAGNHFSVQMSLDATYKGGGRMPMDEIAVYEVKDGKIVNEQFFYSM